MEGVAIPTQCKCLHGNENKKTNSIYSLGHECVSKYKMMEGYKNKRESNLNDCIVRGQHAIIIQ